MRESNAEVRAFNRYSYDGFVDDAKNTLDFCLQIEKDFKINDIKNELEQLASVAKEEESAGIASLIDSINNMQKFMESVKKSMHKRDSGINRLIGNKYGDDEEAYKKDIQDNLKVFTSNARLFFGKKSLGNGLDMSKPLRMRQPLDDFNRKTDCSYYDDHEELIQKIEGLFDKFSALQFLVIRITSLQESFDSDKKINEIINAQRDNRVKFDGIMSKNPGIKTPADVEKQKADLEKKHGTLEKA